MHPRALHSQECFLPPRGDFNLRCTRERYIPKNVFFLREEALIYDAPSLPRKDSRFDQELPSIRGRKCGVKGLVQWHGLMVWSRSWFRTTGKGRERVRVYGILEFTTLDENYRRPVDPVQAHSTKLPWDLPQFPPWEWTLANKGSSGMA